MTYLKERGMIKQGAPSSYSEGVSAENTSHTIAYLNEKLRDLEAKLGEKKRECDEL